SGASFDMWNQNLSINAPSSVSIFSKWLICSMLWLSCAALVCLSTRCTMGSVYHEPKKMPILPLGGRARQKRHIGGRWCFSSGFLSLAWCLYVARVHPFVEQVHGLALAGAVHAADQYDDREFGLLRQIKLRVQQVF